MKHEDYDRYRWIYLGEVIGIEKLIFNPDLVSVNRWTCKSDFEGDDEGVRIARSIDFAIDCGHQTSATTCLAFGQGVDGNFYFSWYILLFTLWKNIQKSTSELSRDIFNFSKSIIKKYRATVDSPSDR